MRFSCHIGAILSSFIEMLPLLSGVIISMIGMLTVSGKGFSYSPLLVKIRTGHNTLGTLGYGIAYGSAPLSYCIPLRQGDCRGRNHFHCVLSSRRASACGNLASRWIRKSCTRPEVLRIYTHAPEALRDPTHCLRTLKSTAIFHLHRRCTEYFVKQGSPELKGRA